MTVTPNNAFERTGKLCGPRLARHGHRGRRSTRSLGGMATETLEAFNGVLLDGLEFCALTYALFERLRAFARWPARLRMRETNTEKKLLEELFPDL